MAEVHRCNQPLMQSTTTPLLLRLPPRHDANPTEQVTSSEATSPRECKRRQEGRFRLWQLSTQHCMLQSSMCVARSINAWVWTSIENSQVSHFKDSQHCEHVAVHSKECKPRLTLLVQAAQGAGGKKDEHGVGPESHLHSSLLLGADSGPGSYTGTCIIMNVRQPHQLNANQRHVHLIEIKYCEDTRPGQQLEAAQRQHADLCSWVYTDMSEGPVTLSIPFTGWYQFQQLGLDHQRAIKLALKLQAHSVTYANKLQVVATRRAIENKNTSHSQVMEPGA
eukprot:1153535-Pelagomonas_calceolata.AAC.7